LINQKSIAVLPFHNTSNDEENQYFADGISEEIISALSKIKGLKVTARTSSFSYRNSDLDVRHIGNELGVSTVLEGSVRKSKTRVRIATQLIRTDTGFQIWSERFDRELTDIFDLQDEVSLLIADRIRENFGHLDIDDQLITTRTETSHAYNSYLKGRYYQLQWTEKSIEQAQQAYKESITADPSYPMPYLGLSQCFTHLAAFHTYDRIQSLYMAYHFIEQLGDKHEHLAEYHYTKGIYHQLGNWEFEKAHTHLAKALSINPNYSEALEAQADLYIAVGEFTSAEKAINKAIELNPNALNHHFIHALFFYYQEHFAEAIIQLEKVLLLDSHWQMALQLKALCELQLNHRNDYQSTISLLSKDAKTGFEILFQSFNKQAVSLDHMVDSSFYFPLRAAILVNQQKNEDALSHIREAISTRSGQYIGFANDPLLASLQTNPQFVEYANHFKGSKSTYSVSDPSQKEGEILSAQEIQHFAQLLQTTMAEDKVYLNAQLSLREVAESLNIHPNKLSWLINQKIGKGFNDYINQYRLKEFQKLALAPENKHITLLGLAFESGFNSKSVFNEYFKKSTGTTPKKWLKAAQ